MSPEELNQKYVDASWLIARRSASAAGKALLFNSESLDDTIREISTLYDLSEGEVAHLQPKGGNGAITKIQNVATGLLGSENRSDKSHAMSIAKTAIENGKTITMIATLLKAGPKAAQAAATGSSVASKGTPWGWIATAGYAAGTAGWFAYNARSFNLEVFEFVRQRDDIESNAEIAETISAKEVDTEIMTIQIKLPTVSAMGSKISKLTNVAGSAIGGMFDKIKNIRP